MDEVFNKNISVFDPKDPQGGKMEIKRKMTLEGLLSILDEASDVVIYYGKKKYKGCLEDRLQFIEEIKPLCNKIVLRIMPTKLTLLKGEYFDGNPYLEIELGD